MKLNVGGWDRGLRLVIGLVLIILGLAGVLSGWGATAAYIIGAIALITGIIGFCPANAILGINSCRVRSEPPKPAA